MALLLLLLLCDAFNACNLLTSGGGPRGFGPLPILPPRGGGLPPLPIPLGPRGLGIPRGGGLPLGRGIPLGRGGGLALISFVCIIIMYMYMYLYKILLSLRQIKSW